MRLKITKVVQKIELGAFKWERTSVGWIAIPYDNRGAVGVREAALLDFLVAIHDEGAIGPEHHGT